MNLLDTHCRHVSSSALQLLSSTATSQIDGTAEAKQEDNRVLKGLSKCPGFAVCLPQLILNLICMQRSITLQPVILYDWVDRLINQLDVINAKFSDHVDAVRSTFYSGLKLSVGHTSHGAAAHRIN